MKLKSGASEKIKRRYLLMNGSRGDIEKAILDYIGILGWAKASPVFVEMKGKDRVVLSVDRKEVDNVRAAFEVAGKSVGVLRVSGTIKGLG